MRRIAAGAALWAGVAFAWACATTDAPRGAARPSAPAQVPARTPPPVPAETLARIEADLAAIPAGTLPSRWISNDVKQPELPVASFRMARHEVTQQDWTEVMGENPSQDARDPRLPVTNVSWHDARRFVDRLNAARVAPLFRLPTAKEWEHACRAGARGRVPMQAKAETLNQYAWWGENAGGASHPVGRLRPNGLGLYDVLGNAAEWCEDAEDPKARDLLRVHAGGSFVDPNMVGQDCSTRAWLAEDAREPWTGFRLAASAPGPAPPASRKKPPAKP